MEKMICIAGLGLIGGSIALGIRRNHPDVSLLGFDKNAQTLKTAASEGLIDETFTEFRVAAERADVIFLCLPIHRIISALDELETFNLKADVLVTDTGSTKSKIMETALDKPFKFIGGHPMAGSHKSGIVAAEVNLFENAYYVLTEQFGELEDLLSGLHARMIVMDAAEHDLITSQVSHFPHLLASALLEQSNELAEKYPLINRMAAGGFRDMTRIAEADSEMWTDIILSNSELTSDRIQDFIDGLNHLKKVVDNKDQVEIQKFFEKGKQQRTSMSIHRGVIPNFYDLSLFVPDEKQVVLKVLKVLEDISIKNIKIQEDNREDILGTLRISFKSELDLQQASEIIRNQTNYKIVE